MTARSAAEVTVALSEIYSWQEALDTSMSQLPLLRVSFFDPASPAASVQQMAFRMEGIHLTESLLLDLYRRHLPAIRAAAAEAR